MNHELSGAIAGACFALAASIVIIRLALEASIVIIRVILHWLGV